MPPCAENLICLHIKSLIENNVNFAARLKTLLTIYLENRNINHSYERLVQLLLSDRFRQTLSYDERCYISDKEGGEDWMNIGRMSRLIDVFQAEREPTKNVFRGARNTYSPQTFSQHSYTPQRPRHSVKLQLQQ